MTQRGGEMINACAIRGFIRQESFAWTYSTHALPGEEAMMRTHSLSQGPCVLSAPVSANIERSIFLSQPRPLVRVHLHAAAICNCATVARCLPSGRHRGGNNGGKMAAKWRIFAGNHFLFNVSSSPFQHDHVWCSVGHGGMAFVAVPAPVNLILSGPLRSTAIRCTVLGWIPDELRETSVNPSTGLS